MKKCPFCGAELRDGAKYCLCCMSALETKTEIKIEKPRPVKLFVTYGAVFLCAAVAVISVFAAKHASASAPAVKNDTETAETVYYNGEKTDVKETETESGASAETKDTSDDVVFERSDTVYTGEITEITDTNIETTSDKTDKLTEAAKETGTAAETEKETTTVKETETDAETEKETATVKETETDAETTAAGDTLVRSKYVIQSARQIHDLMIAEMPLNYNDPDCTRDRLCPDASYSKNGWEGFCMERPDGNSAESYGEPVIYIYNTNEKAVLWLMPELKDAYSDSYKIYDMMYGMFSLSLGLFANATVHGAEYDESSIEMHKLYGEFLHAGTSHSWDTTRDLLHFKAHRRENEWRGLPVENGLPDKAGETMALYGASAECNYWEFYVTEGPKKIKVTFELREWTSNSGEKNRCDGTILLEYAE